MKMKQSGILCRHCNLYIGQKYTRTYDMSHEGMVIVTPLVSKGYISKVKVHVENVYAEDCYSSPERGFHLQVQLCCTRCKKFTSVLCTETQEI